MDAVHVEDLLEHSGWLRGLAAELVADPATADDLVQDTWVAALRRPPVAERSPRAWLARVLRNTDKNRRRGSARREDRELLAHAERTSPAPDDLAQEAEAQRLVAEAVASLDEPYRSVVVLRYFRGLDSRAIGAQLGVPDGTVRRQLAEALKKLRARLDREHGRASWSVLLLPLVTRQAATKSTAGVPMLIQIPLALSIGALATWGGVRLVTAADPEPVAVAPVPANAVASAGPALASIPVEPSRSQPSSVALVQEVEPVEVTGRFVFPNGEPVVGMTVRVQGWQANDERVERYGVPESWSDPSVSTDAEGRFSAIFVAPRAFQFVVEAKQPGYAEDGWRWSELRPGSRMDVGTVTLRPGGAIEGVLVRADGSPITGEAWHVSGSELSYAAGLGRETTRVSADVDPTNGTFRLEDLPVGPARLGARTALAHCSGPSVEVVAGETVTTTITYSGPDTSRRIVVHTRNRLMRSLNRPAEGTIKLLAPQGAIAAERVTGSTFYAFDDIEPGAYTVEIDDPRFVTWRRDDVQTGTQISVDLLGSSSLVLAVEDTAGEPVELYSVRLECLDVNFSPSEYELHDGSAPLTGGRLAGLVAGSYRVRVDAGTSGFAEVDVRDVGPGEERFVHVALVHPAVANGVTGVVLTHEGEPAADVDVLLLSPAVEDDSAESPILFPRMSTTHEAPFRKPVAAAITDAAGAFAFDHPGAGSFILHAGLNGPVSTTTDVFALVDGEAQTGFVLTLPAPAVLDGRILAPPGSSMDGLSLRFIRGRGPLDSDGWVHAMRKPRAVLLNADGSFQSSELTAGLYTAYLELPGGVSFGTDGVVGMQGIGEVELAPGSNVHEFDVNDDFPGTVDVFVFVDGEPLAGAAVSLANPSWSLRSFVTASGDGPRRFRDFPGPRVVEVRDPDGEWAYRNPGMVTAVPAQITRVEVHVELATATLTVTDANGSPLAGAAVQLAFPEGGASAGVGGVRTTGADGSLVLTLPPSAYLCYLLAPDGSDEDAVRDGQRRLSTNDPPLPDAPFTWSTGGAQVQF